MDVQEHELSSIYSWVDEMPLSRPKRNIHRDFADGVLVAEILALYMPKLINLHNYTACSAMNLKLYNWDTLQDRAFKRLGRKLTASDCLGCATARPGAIERVLRLLQHLLLDGSRVSKIPRESISPPVAQQRESSEGSSAQHSGRPCNKRDSPTSQLEAAQHELNSHGSRASSGSTIEEGINAEPADTTAPEAERGVPHSHATNGAEAIAAIENVAGPEDITCLSVELVEGALGESADYLIASYGTYDLKEDSLKPAAFKAAAAAQSEKSMSALATQANMRELKSRIAQLEMDNEQLKRVIGLHKQRCCILEEACLTNGVHVPGGLLAHQHG